MKRHIITLTIMLFIGMIAAPNQKINANSDKEIQALAKFLIDRANENFMYTYKKSIMDNKFIQKYFPSTYDMIARISFDMLIMNKDLLNKCIDEDMRGMYIILLEDILLNVDNYNMNFFIEKNLIFSDKDLKGDGESINILDTNTFKGKHDALQTQIEKLNNNIIEVRNIIKDFNEDNTSINIKDMAKGISDLCDTIIETINTIKKNSPDEKQFDNYLMIISKTKNFFSILSEAIAAIEKVKDDEGNYLTVISYYISIFKDIEIYEKGCIDINLRTSKSFEQFKKFAFLIVQLADAKNEDEKLALLKANILPAVSFAGKRHNDFNLSIGSYLGFSVTYKYYYNRPEEVDKRKTTDGMFGLFAPIGLELSKGINQKIFSNNLRLGTIGVFVNILDLGEVVNNQIYNQHKTFSYKDIFYPGAFIVAGAKEWPLSFGAGCRYHNTRYDSYQVKEIQAIAFFAFDMPLFALY
jgi:hypothetical protein